MTDSIRAESEALVSGAEWQRVSPGFATTAEAYRWAEEQARDIPEAPISEEPANG